MSQRLTVRELEKRLARFENEQAIRTCMNRYMTLCDSLGSHTPMAELAGLFTEDAVWEGVGERYKATFGRLVGRHAIHDMLAKYIVEPPHFRLNAHFLTSELITVTGADRAAGRWMMLQTSTFASGDSHLAAARLTVDFQHDGDAWRISHFRTENLFGRPVSSWFDGKPMPVPR